MKESKLKCDLNSCFLCRSCLKDWHPALDFNRKHYYVKKGEVIFNEGDKVNGVYFVNNGLVKVHKKWGPDKELILRFAKDGAIIGHRGLGKNTFYPVSATALEAGTLCFIDLDFFLTTLKVNTELSFQLLMFFADELQESERKMRNIAHMPVKGRIAQALLTFKEKFGLTEAGSINIQLTRQDLSSYAGATYETVFRVINELVKDSLISVAGKDIKILDEFALSTLTVDTSD